MQRISTLFRWLFLSRAEKNADPKPLNGCSYSDAELEGNPDLKERVLKARRAAWDRGVINQPKVQRNDSLDRSEQKQGAVIS
jgi:hypothetical protein